MFESLLISTPLCYCVMDDSQFDIMVNDVSCVCVFCIYVKFSLSPSFLIQLCLEFNRICGNKNLSWESLS